MNGTKADIERDAAYSARISAEGPAISGDDAQALGSELAHGLDDLEWTLMFLQLPLSRVVDQILRSNEEAALAAEQLLANADLVETLEAILGRVREAQRRLADALATRSDRDRLMSAARQSLGMTATQ